MAVPLASPSECGSRPQRSRACRERASAAVAAADDPEQLAVSERGGPLEVRLAGVVVAALKEAFDRDHQRLELEREQIEAERMRAERLLRIELARQAGNRESAGSGSSRVWQSRAGSVRCFFRHAWSVVRGRARRPRRRLAPAPRRAFGLVRRPVRGDARPEPHRRTGTRLLWNRRRPRALAPRVGLAVIGWRALR